MSDKIEMSIHQALAELKLLDKRITKALHESKFIAMRQGEEPPVGYNTNEDFINNSKSKFQSVKDLIIQRNRIKSGVIKSNAITTITIGNNVMTIAEALDRKISIQYEKELLNSLISQYNEVNNNIQRQMYDFEQRLDKRIESDLGNKDRNTNAKEVEEITNNFTKRYKPNMLDPIEILKEIELLQKEIEEFEMNIDFKLSESNASTRITI